jgi:hypothetical protein
MKVLGYREVNFSDSKTGRPIVGVSVFVAHDEKNVFGEMTEKLFFGQQVLSDCSYAPAVGDFIDVAYNKYGKPQMIRKVK